MPRWDVHLSFGVMAFIVIFSALLMGSSSGNSLEGYLRTAAFFGIVGLLGGGALVFGSVLPDIDGKGRVRWIVGPVAGAMLFIPPLIGSFRSGGPLGAMEFIEGAGSLLFLLGTAAGYLLLVVPTKHRGILHSKLPGAVYGGIWGAYVFYTASMALDQSMMIGTMGALGYGWHLALDGRLL
ncbi:MAG: hypothetical protein ACMUHU_01315 [Thermoplasmatota archaeon]